MQRPSQDVIIIGAGASGLAAAGPLSLRGLKVSILEARSRLGGRIHTVTTHDANVPLELGAEFVHGFSEVTWDLIKEENLLASNTDGEQWSNKGKNAYQIKNFWKVIDAHFSQLQLQKLKNKDCSFAEAALRIKNPQKWLATKFVENFDAAPADRISAFSIAQSHADTMETGGYTSFRLLKGYKQITDILAAKAQKSGTKIHTNARVTLVEWEEGKVRVHYRVGGEKRPPLVAKTLLCTLPVSLLALSPEDARSIRFSPEIPEKRRIATSFGMGSVVKALFVMRKKQPLFGGGHTKLLQKRGLERMNMFHLRGGAFPTWWSMYPTTSNVFTGWAGGTAAQKLSSLNRAEIEEVAFKSLSQVLAAPVRTLEKLVSSVSIANWQSDSFSLGAYSYATVGSRSILGSLASPIGNTLFFAGEAAGQGGVGGTVGSAIESGQQAARVICKKI